MSYSVQTGKVTWSNNSVLTTTSGTIAGSTTSGYISNGTGYVSGGGGGGSITTTHQNMEKATLDIFGGGTMNVSFNCDQLFSPGHIATVASRNRQNIAFFNHTTNLWYYQPPGKTVLQGLTVASIFLFVVYNLYMAFPEIGSLFSSFGRYGPPFSRTLLGLLLAMLPSLIAIGAFIWYRRRFLRVEKAKVREMIRGHEKKYESEIATSKERHRAAVAAL